MSIKLDSCRHERTEWLDCVDPTAPEAGEENRRYKCKEWLVGDPCRYAAMDMISIVKYLFSESAAMAGSDLLFLSSGEMEMLHKRSRNKGAYIRRSGAEFDQNSRERATNGEQENRIHKSVQIKTAKHCSYSKARQMLTREVKSDASASA